MEIGISPKLLDTGSRNCILMEEPDRWIFRSQFSR